MIIDNRGKLFGKISIVDILVILIVLGVAAGVAYKFTKSKTSGVFVKQDDIQTVIYIEEMNNFTAEAMKVGDVVKDGTTNSIFGQVQEVKIMSAVSYASDAAGIIKQSSKPLYVSVEITIEGKGIYGNSGITFGNVDYYVGQLINMLRVGNEGVNYKPIFIKSMRKR